MPIDSDKILDSIMRQLDIRMMTLVHKRDLLLLAKSCYKHGDISIGKAAELIGVSTEDMMKIMRDD